MAEHQPGDTGVKIVYLPEPCHSVEEWQEKDNRPHSKVEPVQ